MKLDENNNNVRLDCWIGLKFGQMILQAEFL